VQGAQGRGLDALSTGIDHEEPLRVRTVVIRALRVARARPARVAGTAALVFGGTAWFTTLVELEIVHHTNVAEVQIAARTATAAISAFAVVFYAGLLDLVVGAFVEGRREPTTAEVLRALPHGRLVAADLLLTIGTVVGLLLLIVPGIAFFTFCSLVGPIVVNERLTMFRAFARSARLVHGHFWHVLVLVTIPIAIEDQVMHAVDPDVFGHPLIASFVLTAVLGALVGSMVGLLEVVIAHELRRRHPLRPSVETTRERA
jgi:hypothetical protein